MLFKTDFYIGIDKFTKEIECKNSLHIPIEIAANIVFQKAQRTPTCFLVAYRIFGQYVEISVPLHVTGSIKKYLISQINNISHKEIKVNLFDNFFNVWGK